MTKKKLTKLDVITILLINSKHSAWQRVNIHNEFQFMQDTYKIDESVKEYKVFNKAGEIEDYTNEAYMETILIVVDEEDTITYYNENYDLVESKFVKRDKGWERWTYHS